MEYTRRNFDMTMLGQGFDSPHLHLQINKKAYLYDMPFPIYTSRRETQCTLK